MLRRRRRAAPPPSPAMPLCPSAARGVYHFPLSRTRFHSTRNTLLLLAATAKSSCVHFLAFRDALAANRAVFDQRAADLAAHVMPARPEDDFAFVGQTHDADEPVIRRRLRATAVARASSHRWLVGTQQGHQPVVLDGRECQARRQ